MSRVKIPSREEILDLGKVRSDLCVSIYLETSPLAIKVDECRIALGNLVKQALKQAQEAGRDKKRIEALRGNLEQLISPDGFCREQANSLAVLATPEEVHIFKLANQLGAYVEVADRFYLKPLLRSLTFPHRAYILAISENANRVIELFADAAPQILEIPSMPPNAAEPSGLDPETPLAAMPREGDLNRRKKWLAEYSRQVDEALRLALGNCDAPVILAAAEPMASVYRSVAAACLAEEGISIGPDKIPVHELAGLARPVLDRFYAAELQGLKQLFEQRAGERRVVTDLGDAAHAATFGLVDLALVDFEHSEQGEIDAQGRLTLGESENSYGVIDEIVRRAIENGARVLAVRKADMIGNTGVAAILRYAP